MNDTICAAKTEAVVCHPREDAPLTLGLATPAQREEIYRLRHEVYARELGQHHANPQAILRDELDGRNIYLVATVGSQIAGFVSVTPPPCSHAGDGESRVANFHYSVDKYISRDALPFPFDDRLYEIRLLTVLKPHRGRELATMLMYAAFRWVEAHGGTRIVAIGRREIIDMYLRSGLQQVGVSIQSGAVTYDVLQVSISVLREHMRVFHGLLERLESKTVWQLNFPFRKPASCFHGGAFFSAIGTKFETLERNHQVINADVLDAWFPPAPGVLAALHEYLPWLLRTSPPTAGEGLIQWIAQARGVRPDNILPGAGSSDLIFRALRQWLSRASHALILDPTYGEYAHVLERVIGCTVDRLSLSGGDNYAVDLDRLEAALADNYDLVVLVNPNSPTGRHVPRFELERILQRVPARTRVWVDETYVEYANVEGFSHRPRTGNISESLERCAADSENVIVCKSMSKVYALSGARVAYLCAGPHQLEEVRAITPPWIVSLPAQVAAVRALQDPEYYAARYVQTADLRDELAAGLASLGLDVVPGIANFLLAHLPNNGPDAAMVVKRCCEQGLFLRDAQAMGSQLGTHMLRIAVKEKSINRRMLEILSQTLS